MAQDSKVDSGEEEQQGVRPPASDVKGSKGQPCISLGGRRSEVGSSPRPGVWLSQLSLTRRWRLQLGLFLGIPCAEDFRRGLLPTLNFALEGEQVLNILLFQGTSRAA